MPNSPNNMVDRLLAAELPTNLAEAFHYLDELRLSGEVNMYGAASHLARDLSYEKAEARRALSAWRETFDDDLTAEARADKAAGMYDQFSLPGDRRLG